ncbi:MULTISPECIES: ATP-grasp domain-containing protein [Marinobacter]|jgi:predicted ATP-grasp superfamily ATP-dependent carboligase|uniref:Predicted ATP-dependent carboligase, ATP-grasp superfamily n=1 Tax=Marinobacter salarius TaxID=1420917 RepID=A0ABY1FJ95_9GAMM|nr:MULTISPECIES: ATP-grasp domain-containing protein [Marinobacter]KXJ47242.1 MAG: carboxylate--amine ligase [Marinobacter sp. Hex_13]MBS8230989.1 carboxylate--amine ligase [Marinobacter salarius]SFL45660.1 Predicted ATP-dependent carboligase, ATP-grasp superfamily [Marinobacter salarius]
MEPRILILDGNQRASLAAVRSLGSKGLWVAVGESAPTSMAAVSRYCSQKVTYSDPYRYPRAFFDDILNQISALGITFLLPITEATTYVLLLYRNEIPDHVVLPFPDTEAVDQLANKNKLFKMAAESAVPIPETVFCENSEQGLNALGAIGDFPVVLKPFKSKILDKGRILSSQVIVAKSRDEARSALSSHESFDFPFTIQSFIYGTGQGIFALFNHGEPVCYFAHRRLREKPPGGGVSVLCESAPVDERLKSSAETLLRKAKWHGVAMVEFRVSADGTGYLMEVNPRFWGSLQLAIDSGIDFPYWLYLASTGRPVPKAVQEHRRVRWLLGDLDRLYLVLKAPSTSYSTGAKLLEIIRFLKPGLRTRHEVNRLSDLRPFWFELKQYLGALRN